VSALGGAPVYGDATLTLRVQHNLLVASWYAAPTVAQMRCIGEQFLKLSRSFGNDVGFANLIIRARVEQSTKEAREEALLLLKRFRENRCFAHVVFETGLTGALVKTVLRTIGMAGPNRGSVRVFGSTLDAAGWIASKLTGHADRAWSSSEVLTLLNFASKTPLDGALVSPR